MYKRPFFLLTSFSALHAANPFVLFFIILFIDVAQGTQFHLDWSIASGIYGSKHGPPHFKLSRIVFHFFFWRQLSFFVLLLLRLLQGSLRTWEGTPTHCHYHSLLCSPSLTDCSPHLWYFSSSSFTFSPLPLLLPPPLPSSWYHGMCWHTICWHWPKPYQSCNGLACVQQLK